MNPRSTGMLAIAALLLGSFIYFYEIGGEVDREAAEQAGTRIFPQLDAASIASLELVTQDGVPARFERVDGAWELVEPVRGPADPVALEAMTSVLVQLGSEGEVEATGSLSEFGLDPDARTIHFDVDGESRALRIGRAAPVGGHLYVLALTDDVPGERIAYVESFRINAFNRSLADLRDRSVLTFDPVSTTEIEASWPGGEVSLEKRGDMWWMRSPVEEPADETTVQNLLRDLSYLRATRFIDPDRDPDATSDAEDALRKPAMQVRLVVAGEEIEATMGGLQDEERIVRGRGGRLFSIAEERFEDFERSVPSYRFRTLSEFEIPAARRLSLTFATGEGQATSEAHEVVARLGESGWTTDSEDLTIDSDRFSEVIQTLSPLRATTIVADEMGPSELASLGLAPPRLRLRVVTDASGDDSSALAEVRIGRVDEDRGVYAQRAGDSKIYLLDPAIAESLPVSWDAFEAGFLDGHDADRDELEFEAERGFDPDGEAPGEDPLEGLGFE